MTDDESAGVNRGLIHPWDPRATLFFFFLTPMPKLHAVKMRSSKRID